MAKNLRLQWDLNSDLCSVRQACWPLDHRQCGSHTCLKSWYLNRRVSAHGKVSCRGRQCVATSITHWRWRRLNAGGGLTWLDPGRIGCCTQYRVWRIALEKHFNKFVSGPFSATPDLWNRMRLFYHLSHNHCPTFQLVFVYRLVPEKRSQGQLSMELPLKGFLQGERKVSIRIKMGDWTKQNEKI